MFIQEFFRNIFKYLIEGIGVAVATFLVSGQRYSLQEVGLIGLSASLTLMLLDMYAPAIGLGARQGTGFGLGLRVNNLPVEGFDDESESAPEVHYKDKVHYSKTCNCQTSCANTCQVSDDCKAECNTAPCYVNDKTSLASNNCSYKMIDGNYSVAVLPGYNECVKAYNDDT
jgi:hypothetical protein